MKPCYHAILVAMYENKKLGCILNRNTNIRFLCKGHKETELQPRQKNISCEEQLIHASHEISRDKQLIISLTSAQNPIIGQLVRVASVEKGERMLLKFHFFGMLQLSWPISCQEYDYSGTRRPLCIFSQSIYLTHWEGFSWKTSQTSAKCKMP